MNGVLVAAAALAIASLTFMFIKFLLHEAMVLYHEDKEIIRKVSLLISILSILCSLASAICSDCADNYAGTPAQRISWPVIGFQIVVLSYYSLANKLKIKQEKKKEFERKVHEERGNYGSYDDSNGVTSAQPGDVVANGVQTLPPATTIIPESNLGQPIPVSMGMDAIQMGYVKSPDYSVCQ